MDRQTLWKLLRHEGIQLKIPNIIRNSYEGMSCRVVHGQQLTDAFQIRTRVRHGCLLSPVVFLPDDGLGNEEIYSPRAKSHPVDTLEAAG